MSRALTKSRTTAASEANVLGRSVRIRGRVTGDGDLRVEGDIEGDVKIGGTLEVADAATVAGNVTANSVLIDGALTGDVDATGPVHIRASARVEGNMSGSEVALEEGASFSGRIDAIFELPDGLGGNAGTRRGK
ncbi:MAG: polymer-forming cytoskeletal protein [Myxococcales bacterium]|jgi:cytoskeletal protein CcmA (bactofilin family)|nr:polymer-forming cytoskeletal protein [Myxococcales bacterium]